MKEKFTTVAFFLQFICMGLLAQIPLVYSVENTGSNCPEPPLPFFSELPAIEPLTDPFMWSNNTGRSTDFSDWQCRRNEIKREIENYEIGIKPPRPDTITATYVPGINGGTLTVIVVRHGRSLTLTSRISLPSSGSGPFPAVIGMALAPGNGTGSLPADIFTNRNVATIEYLHNQVTTYAAGQRAPKVNDPFYILYPELIDNGQYSAWSWGISRLIDGLEIAQQSLVNRPPIDLKHLAVTGCSYAGKMALFAGALDERIALTIAQESGGGGAPSWRVSHSEPNGTVEKIDNTDYSWFMESMRQFSGDNVYKMPHDHHELMAMIAPRALLVTGNTDFTWLSNRSCYVSARATKEVYKTFGIGDRMGFYIDGGHGHCAIPQSQRPAIEAFVDKFLLGKTDVNTDTITVHPYGDMDYERWYKWWGTENPVFPDDPSSVKIWLEAECGTLGANWDMLTDTAASNGKYVTVKSGLNSIDSAPTSADATIVLPFAVDSAAAFNFLARVNCPSEDDDSFWISIDDGPFVMANGLTTSGWAWVHLTNANLSPGEHTLSIAYREDGAQLDKVLITTSGATVYGHGDAASNCYRRPVVTPSQRFIINNKIENNAVVGTVSVSDAEPNTTLQDWQINGGTGAKLFDIDPSSGELKVFNRSGLNFEHTRTYTLEVTVSDGIARSREETVIIELTHVPVITPNQAFHIGEWVKDNHVAGQVTATDKDPNTNFRQWRITGGSGASYFAVDEDNGEIKAINSATLNQGNVLNYSLLLTVSDSLNTSDEETVTITVSDKVYVCHNGHTLHIRRADAKDHVDHGDKTGSCETKSSTQDNSMRYGTSETGETNHTILVYPNPARDHIFINLGTNPQHITSIQVVDLLGKVFKHVQVSQGENVVILRENLKPGFYLIRLHGDKVHNKAIVIQ